MRDFADEFDSVTYALFFKLLCAAWKDGRPDVVCITEGLLSYVMAMPEYNSHTASEAVSPELLRSVISRFDGAPEKEHAFLRNFLHLLYRDALKFRPLLRALLARFLAAFIHTGKKTMAVAPVLEVLGHIIKGFASPLTSIHRRLFVSLLLPLHENNDMYEWRDQLPVIQLYHEPLVFCLTQYLERDRGSFALPILRQLLKSWPEKFESNSAKEVLCLHELGALLHYFSDHDFAEALPLLLPRLSHCLASDHSRCVEKALILWKDEAIVGFTKRFASQVIRALLRSVYRDGEKHWNVTVNKMRVLVLKTFQEADGDVFAEVASREGSRRRREEDGRDKGEGVGNKATPAVSSSAHMPPPPRAPASLYAQDAAGWKPPRRTSATVPGGQRRQPPVTITGMAPWAKREGVASDRLRGHLEHGGRQQQPQPPVVVTGVAPWAMDSNVGYLGPGRTVEGGGKSRNMGQRRLSAQPPPRTSLPPPWSSQSDSPLSQPMEESDGRGGQIDAVLEEEEGEAEDGLREVEGEVGRGRGGRLASEGEAPRTSQATTNTRSQPIDPGGSNARGSTIPAALEGAREGLERVLGFMEEFRPASSSEGQAWYKLQLEPTPTLLPEMRFHDLVFGHDLGSGAFSTVRYARHVTKDKTRSDWAEFAVKVIDTARLVELGYEACVNREIAVLRLLSHPGIARMVSSFRWRDGVYLVLEYASKGDLHSYLVARGSLDEDSVRFVAGEVVAALCSVHAAGFVFGDLKPENVVITESGHVKVTDFGACRPLTPAARATLRASRHAIQQLRDGDWRSAKGLVAAGGERTGMGNEVGPRAVQPPGGGAEGRGRGPEGGQGSPPRSPDEHGQDGGGEKEEEDGRIEGTFAYLPPEVVRDGAVPDALSDSWALGCLLFQLLMGRPPVFTEHDTSPDTDIRERVVRFAEGQKVNGDFVFGEAFLNTSRTALTLSDDVKSLIKSLLKVERNERISVEAAAKHAFFTNHGVNVHVLYQGPAVQLVHGAAGPTPDAAWNRRQFSAIWAPLPGKYNFVSKSYTLGPIAETDIERDSLFCYENNKLLEEEKGKTPERCNIGLPLPPKRPDGR